MVILIFSFKPSGFRSAGVKRGFQFWFWNEFDDTIRGCVFQIFSAHPYEGFFRCNLILWASPNSMLRVTISIAGGDSFVCQSKWYEPEYKIWVPRGQGKVKDNAAQQLRQALVAFFAADPEFPMITDLPFYVFQRSRHFENVLSGFGVVPGVMYLCLCSIRCSSRDVELISNKRIAWVCTTLTCWFDPTIQNPLVWSRKEQVLSNIG